MVRYFVNQREVELSSDLSFEIVRENVLVNKAGDYTLDIPIDLRSKNNREIYDQPLRMNSKFEYIDRGAELWIDGVIVMSGKEAVLDISDRVARVQIVCNNSEMIYKFNSLIKIRNLDLGRVNTLNAQLAAAAVNKTYPATDETYPIIIKHGIGVDPVIWGNLECYNKSVDLNETRFDDTTDLMPQPFLLAIVDKVIDAIGYQIGQNEIDIEKYKHVILIQNYDKNRYSKMLPDWTVEEFIREVEKFFNVIFDFVSETKTVNIISVKNFYTGRNHINIGRNNVIDIFSVDFQQEAESFNTSYENVGYNLPADNYWRMQNIDKGLMETVAIENKEWSWPELEEGQEYEKKIYYDGAKDIQWILRKASAGGVPTKVNDFADYVASENIGRNTLKIIPTRIAYNYTLSDWGSYEYAAPVIADEADEAQTFVELITEGNKERIPSNMEVAFYLGRNSLQTECVTTYWNAYNKGLIGWGDSIDWLDKTYTLKLNGRDGRVVNEFKNDISLDTQKLFTIRFLAKKFLDPKMIFDLGDDTFYCKCLKYSVVNCKKSMVVEGEFYKRTQEPDEITPDEPEEPGMVNLKVKNVEGVVAVGVATKMGIVMISEHETRLVEITQNEGITILAWPQAGKTVKIRCEMSDGVTDFDVTSRDDGAYFVGLSPAEVKMYIQGTFYPIVVG